MSIQQEQEIIKHRNARVSTLPLPALGEDRPRNVAARVSQDGPQDRTDRDGFTPSDIEEFEASEEVLEPSTPLLLTRGAHTTPLLIPQQQTLIDWLSFTALETVSILEQFTTILIPDVKIFTLKHGQPGYKFTKEINLNGQAIGRLAYGANHGRNLFTLTGKGTAKIQWEIFLQYYQILTEPKFSRIDIAKDFFNGEVSHESVLQNYENGNFTPAKSPKKPSINIISGSDGYGNNKGRTVNIGNKKSSKFIRCYEKGLEQFAKIFDKTPDEEKPNPRHLSCFDLSINHGDTPLLNWYRLEVQYGNADRELSSDMIINRDEYFSGAYPYCKEVLEMTTGKTPPRIPNNTECDIELMFKHMSDQYGSFITTMISMGMTPEDIVRKVANGKQSQRIIKTGALDRLAPYEPRF